VIAGFPVKLPDGTWGACIRGVDSVKISDRVSMTSARGETWTAEVTGIVEDFRGTYLVKVRRLSS
jgi:DNA/RNA endonuclease YhcR with UshA esterase domain